MQADGDLIINGLLRAAKNLNRDVQPLKFGPPVTHIYNPLVYAWAPYEAYLRRFAASQKRVVFLGMNPGPFGMVQTGVPFGEIAAVRNWLRIGGRIGRPANLHRRRPVFGFECPRSEVSGRRLWGLFAERFGTSAEFFTEHIVMNYCPLAFVEASGHNRTPDKLPVAERTKLFAACDQHLRAIIEILQPEWLIAIGDFAWQRARGLFLNSPLKLGRILHPSPANPAANREWAVLAARQLEALGVWEAC